MNGIGLILDTSAVVAFVTGSEAVGETIGEVQESGRAFTAPVDCLAAAEDAVHQRPMLELLIRHPAFAALTIGVEHWHILAASLSVLGRLDLAAALTLHLLRDCDILTDDGQAYRVLGDDPPIIGIS